ncbi:MAG: hypothetical protein Q4D44_07630 [Eubacteriales bacterium]|nr:hypothetical protein [Eubacteriales bacterium]
MSTSSFLIGVLVTLLIVLVLIVFIGAVVLSILAYRKLKGKHLPEKADKFMDVDATNIK